MDQFVVDVTGLGIEVADTVTIFGDPATAVPSATDLAGAPGTIACEILTGIGTRMPRCHDQGDPNAD
ncbi:hypothetical protein JYB55_24660 [Mycolicibacterium septicum]|nr:hypothetical protein [Mycolicibacterium septicum]